MLDNRKRLTYSVVALLIIGASFFTGLRMGESRAADANTVTAISNQIPTSDISADFSPFWKAWKLIDDKYTPSSTSTKSNVTSQDRIWGAISGMVAALGDPYTVFLPPEESKVFESDIAGNFEGVGMEVDIRDGVLTVIAPLKGTPAYKAGIKPGDKIIRIDDKSTDGMPTDEAVRLIRGKGGTQVSVTVIRDGVKQPFEIKMTRAVIDIPTLDYDLRSDGVFVIHLYNFSATSPNLFRTALREFVRTGSNKLLLDLRGNPGGYLEAAVDMASWFLPAGDIVVSEHYRDGREDTVHRSRGYDIFPNNLRMVILIDKGSASAAEILAGALKEQGIATLIGDTSFGKGSVQELIKITPDSSLKVTVAQWLTPKGNSITLRGIEPDVKVIPTDADIKAVKDVQFNAGINYLLKK